MTAIGLPLGIAPTSGDAAPAADQADWISAALRDYEGPLVLYASRITRDVDRARDVVQEAFLRLIREDRESRQVIRKRLAEWLYTVCRNLALDIRRKESRQHSLSDEAADRTIDTLPGPDEALQLRESSGKVLACLARLPANQQEVLRLKFQQGLSYKQISAITQLSVSNVGFLIHVGLKGLRERLGLPEPTRCQS